MRRTRLLTLLALAAIAAFVVLARREPPGVTPAGAPRVEDGAAEVARLFAEHRSGVWIGVEGTVERRLDDDLRGDRHQRFIVRLDDGPTILVSHNIDLAPRVPAQPGDPIEIYGRYEWNERGGVVHWTHRDPHGRDPGGWIRHRGVLYR